MLIDMHKLFSLLFAFFANSILSPAQSSFRVSIGDHISVEFPCEPEIENIGENGKDMYLCKQDGCGYMVGVSPNLIKDYDKFQKHSREKQLKCEDTILRQSIGGKLSIRNKSLISSAPYHLGKYVGYNIIYSEPDPTVSENPEPRMRYIKTVIIKNTLYTIECWYLDERLHDAERDRYFESIVLRE